MFATYRASSWKEIKENFSNRPLWAYRGQSEASWPLETSLYREYERNNQFKSSLVIRDLRQREAWLLYQFRRFAHQLRPDLPEKNNILEWLALIQHYGGPTRLLDMTYSLHIAAFFAVECASRDAAIWAVHLQKLWAATHNKGLAVNFGDHADVAQKGIHQSNNKKFEELMFDENAPIGVMHVEPDQMHERLWIQQGLFLAPSNPNQTFVTNLANNFDNDPRALDLTTELKWSTELDNRLHKNLNQDGYIAAIKIVIPRALHQEILADLKSVNITAATLFPGLEGFARSLKYHV